MSRPLSPDLPEEDLIAFLKYLQLDVEPPFEGLKEVSLPTFGRSSQQ